MNGNILLSVFIEQISNPQLQFTMIFIFDNKRKQMKALCKKIHFKEQFCHVAVDDLDDY